jgi:hypothetical protein
MEDRATAHRLLHDPEVGTEALGDRGWNLWSGKRSLPGDSQNLGAPGRTRTFDPRLRRPVLYPTELRARALHVTRPPEPVGLERRHSGSVDRDRREESPSGQPGRSIEGFEERCPHVRSALQCPEHFSVGPRRMSRHSYVPHHLRAPRVHRRRRSHRPRSRL